MTDIISNVCAAIKTIGKTTGITTSWDPPPVNLETAHLPALYVFTGTATDDDRHTDLFYVKRTFRLQVAVIPTGQGNPNTRETLCRPLLESVKSVFRHAPGLNGVNWVQRARVTGDSGIVLLPEWGGKFIGFEIRLEVETIEI